MHRGDRIVFGRTGSWAAAACLVGAVVLAVVSGQRQPPAFGEPAVTSPTDASPALTATPVPDPTATSSPATVPAPTQAPAPPISSVAGTGIVVDHYVLARVRGPGRPVQYGPVDRPILDAARLDTIRIRVRLRNTAPALLTVRPQLEARRAGAAYNRVPETPTPSAAFHLTREWRPIPAGHGRSVLGPADEAIAVTELRFGDGVRGDHSMAANPAPSLTLPAGASTEQEFTVRVNMTADFTARYELRVTNADANGVAVTGSAATIRVGPEPRLRLSPNQRAGVAVPEGTATARSGRGTGIAFPLIATSTARAATTTAVHGPYSMTSGACAVCHRGHTAAGPNLLTQPAPTSSLCLSCHDGTGAVDVQSQYTDPSVPADDPGARDYYRHDALVPSTHSLAQTDEFGGVSNRHADCADCHNPHQAQSGDSATGASGWTPSGRLAGTSGVAVVNGAAGTAPSYTFLDGVANPVTLEYQLCFKCHSGFTVLPSNTGVAPSRYELDKGVEFNPANRSYHPIEAAGTNQTSKMADSLAGTSPYKLWTFPTTGTVRCTNCHASGAVTGSPAAGADLSAHTSSYRGVLLRNYRDRALLPAQATYAAENFALCFVCHAEAPYANETTYATNFEYHGMHVADLSGKGSGGTDIDTPGDGQGNALCSECHFRLHSTTYRVGEQSGSGARLVNFAPNVKGVGGTSPAPDWQQTATGGTCTLTCHGYRHNAMSY